MKIFVDKRILVISPERWSHNFLSKHHYALELCKAGNSVFFLNPPGSVTKIHLADATCNVSILDYKPTVRGLNRLPFFLRDLFNRLDILNIEKMAGGKFDVVWSFDPYRFQNLYLFKSQHSLYFAADLHANKKLEKLLADSSQLVVAPSQIILNTIITPKTKIKINHAVSDYFLTPSFGDEPENKRVKIGYVGNLNSKYLDYPLLKEIVLVNDACDFVFIGENAGFDLPIHAVFVGRKKNEDLPTLLQTCDVLLLCYDTNLYWKEASNSHKIMEYLASGKVIVSTRIAEYIDKPHLVIMPEKNSYLPQLVQDICHKLKIFNSESNKRMRIEFARENSYKNQLLRIDHYLSNASSKKT